MKAELKHYKFTDIDSFQFTKPKSGEDFFKELEMDIGLKGDKGSDRFSITICNNGALLNFNQRAIEQFGFVELVHVLVFDELNEDKILTLLRAKINSIDGESWEEITNKLSIFLDYEFAPKLPKWEISTDGDV